MIRTSVPAVLLGVLLATGLSPAQVVLKDPRKSDLQSKIQGNWSVTACSKGGDANVKMMKARIRIVESRMVATYEDGDADILDFEIVDAIKQPVQIDLMRRGTGPAQIARGILELDGNVLRIAANLAPGQARPATFDEKGPEIILFSLQRAK